MGNPRRQADDRARVTFTRMVQEVLLDWPGAEIDPILDTSVDATVDVEEPPPNVAAMVNLEELGRNIVVEVKSSHERQERGQHRADQDVPHASAIRKTFRGDTLENLHEAAAHAESEDAKASAKATGERSSVGDLATDASWTIGQRKAAAALPEAPACYGNEGRLVPK